MLTYLFDGIILNLPHRLIIISGDNLEITYKNKKIEKECTDPKTSDKIYGANMTEKLHLRIDQISATDSVEEMLEFRIGRCHALTNNRKGQFAVDLIHPYRLIFTKLGNNIQIAHIIEIVDYH